MRLPGSTLAALCLCALLASSAFAAPRFLRVSFTDADDTATKMTVSWNSDATTDPSMVEYGTTASFGMTATGAAIQGTGDLKAIHQVDLAGLQPDTEYHYRVGGPGAWSASHTFRTGPDDLGCTPVRFVAMGDGRSDDSTGPSPKWNPILAEAVDKEPAFIVLTGDQVKEGDEVHQWVNWLDATEAGSPSVPLMPSLGNHDDDKVEGPGAMYNQIFALPPNSATGTEDFYYFTYGDAIFVSLSMVTYKSDGFAQQAAWLDQVLTDNPRTWKFVFFHHPIYTGVLGIPGLLELNHPPNEQGQNALLVPIFDAHHVDIVFNGHNHHYQRFQPMCCGGGADSGTVTGSTDTGTTYVITGGAGALTYDLSILNIDLPALLCLTPGSAMCNGKHHYMVMDIDGNDLSVEVWSTAAQLLGSDPGNIALIDTFEIHKSGAAPMCDPTAADPGPEPMPEPSPEPSSEPVAEPIAEPVAEPAPDAGPTDTGGPPPTDTGTTPDTAGPAPDTTDPTPDAGAPPVDVAVATDSTTQPPADTGATGGTGGTGATSGSEDTGCAGAPSSTPLAVLIALVLFVLGRLRQAQGVARQPADD